MTNRIVQKHPDRGTREFMLVDDAVEYKIKSPFGDEELSVVLSVLAPEPVKDGPMMYFLSEVNREALIKMFIDLPDAETFAKFVSTVQQRIREESFGTLDTDNRKSDITKEQIDTTIHMLETYLYKQALKYCFRTCIASLRRQTIGNAWIKSSKHSMAWVCSKARY